MALSLDRNLDGTFKEGHIPFSTDSQLLSQIARNRLAEMSREQRLEHVKRSCLSVQRWNKGKHYSRPEIKGKHYGGAPRRMVIANCVICNSSFQKRVWDKRKTCSEECKTILGIENGKRVYFSCTRRPTRPEKSMATLLQKIFPDEYKYVGNGKIWIQGKNPDFINIKGKKKIVEVWGDFWHKGQCPEKRILFFKNQGFQTIIVWEHELEASNLSNLTQKLEAFQND